MKITITIPDDEVREVVDGGRTLASYVSADVARVESETPAARRTLQTDIPFRQLPENPSPVAVLEVLRDNMARMVTQLEYARTVFENSSNAASVIAGAQMDFALLYGDFGFQAGELRGNSAT